MPQSRTAQRLLDLAVAVGVVYLGAFLWVAFSRLGYPFEVEWMEGGMVTHAARLLEGEPIYGPPSADFVPFFYTPGYPMLLAWLAPVTGGLSFGLARAVSLLATLGTMGLLFRVGQREAGWRYGLLGVGIYAALFRTNGAFYDLARPDALFLLVVLVGVYVAYYVDSWKGAVAAGLVMALAYFTKQTSSVFVPAVAVFLVWRNWRHALLFVGCAFAPAVLGVWWLDRSTDGWFWTYVFEGHQGHLFYWKNILMEYWRDVLFLAPLLLLLPLLYFSYAVAIPALSVLLAAHWTYAWIFRARTLDYVPHMYYRELWYEAPRWQILVPPALVALLLLLYRGRNRLPTGAAFGATPWFWLLMFVAGVGSSGLNHSTQWAYSNCFMPLSIFAALLVVLATRDFLQSEGVRWAPLVPLAVLVQLAAWAYSPAAQTPDDVDRAAYADLERRLDAVDGKVFMPAHPLFGYLRDGEVHVHQMGLQDVAYRGGVGDIRKRLAAKEWAAVVVDERTTVSGIERGYYEGHRLRYETPDALRARTGFLVRPASIWYRQDAEPRALGAGVSANFETPGWVGWAPDGDSFGKRPSTSRRANRQGKRVASSRKKARGKLTSAPVTVERRWLTFLMGGTGRTKVWVRVLADGQEVARQVGVRDVKRRLRRVALDLQSVVGREVVLEVVDDDPRHTVVVDDFRWAE